MKKLRKSSMRGFFNHGWLKSFHSFSFGDYYDENHVHFGNLRVINEDFIQANHGFGKHPHQNMEIITYVISGALSHQDSMGNSSIISAGEVQVISAGSGVFHSEFNHENRAETHLLQIWIFPKEKNTAPRYEQKSFANKTGLTLVVSGAKEGESLTINQNAKIYLGKFSKAENIDFDIAENRKIWLQVISGKVEVDNFVLESGDALAISAEKRITLKIDEKSEFLLFDL